MTDRKAASGKPENLSTRQQGSRNGSAAKVAEANERAAELRPILRELRAAGVTSHVGLAASLNERGIPALRGGRWTPEKVRRLLKRLKGAP